MKPFSKYVSVNRMRCSLVALLLLMLSGCSSQGATWLLGEVFDELSPGGDRLHYDEAAIFPAPNQRLACQMDMRCTKPLTSGDFNRLSDEERFRTLH